MGVCVHEFIEKASVLRGWLQWHSGCCVLSFSARKRPVPYYRPSPSPSSSTSWSSLSPTLFRFSHSPLRRKHRLRSGSPAFILWSVPADLSFLFSMHYYNFRKLYVVIQVILSVYVAWTGYVVICDCYTRNFAQFVKANFSSLLFLYSCTGIKLLHIWYACL